MIALLIINCITFSLLGFIIGILSNNFEQLNLVPMLIITPLVFLGGSFYSIEMLPSFWQTVTLFNPVMYLISIFRWAFFDVADVPIIHSFVATLIFSMICISVIFWIFKTGYKLKS